MRTVILLVLSFVVLISCAKSEKSCSDTEENARALVESYAQCSEGDSCIIVNMYEYAGDNNCLMAFQCSAALRAGSDLEAFRSAAQALTQDYSGCQTCSQAGCISLSAEDVFCNIEKKRCEIRLK